MAKAKKKENLTPEERLQAALVPDCEQPYKVPKNWCWTYIKLGFDVTSSKRVHKKDWLTNGIPFYRTRELVKLSENGYVNNELFISEELYNSFVDEYGIPQTGDLLISGVGTIGIPYVIKEKQKFYFKDGNIIWFKNRGIFNSEYVYFLYKSAFVSEQIHQMSSGTTVDTYTIVNANSTIVPLPPLPEQRRIVDRIESLFAKLDEVKQKVQDALDSFETRKAAILHKAFTGELTAPWRKEHGVGMESWENTTMGKIASFHQGVQVAVDEQFWDYEENRVRFIRIVDYTQGTEKERYVSCDKIRNESYVKGDEIVMVRYGATAGFVGDGIEGLIANNMFVVDVSDNIREYIKVFLKSPAIYNKLNTSGGSTAMPALNFKTVSAIEVPLPSEKEQTEIVRILDDLLAKEQQAKEAAEAVLEQIDLMKKSILARAFRGELGTNDPTEESAVELVRNII